jgi:hypothetical protein
VPKASAVLPLLVLLGCAADASASSVDRPVSPTAPTIGLPPPPPTSVLDDVRAAYDRSWAVYAAAVGRVDPSGLRRAFADSALGLRRREVAALARTGAAVRVRVTHHADVALVDPETAIVTDVLDNHMVRVDAETRRPLEPDPDDRLTRAYTLRLEDGTWKVTEAAAL